MGYVDDKAYDLEKRLNALMGRVGLVDAGSNPEVVSGAGLVQNISGSGLAAVSTIAGLSSAVLTSAGFIAVPGGDVEVGSSYQIHASGTFGTGGTPPASITFGIYWDSVGGTQLVSCTPPGAITGGLSNIGWSLDAEVNWMTTGEATCTLRVYWHTNAGIGNEVIVFNVGTQTGLATNATKNLSVGVQWTTPAAGTTLNCDVCRIAKVA